MPDHDDSWFGDLNRDGREDWRDDMLGMWLVGETLRLQRERRQLQEKLERERREREQERLWRDLRANRRRAADEDDDDDDFVPIYRSRRTAPTPAVTRPASPPATAPPAPEPARATLEPPAAPPSAFRWLPWLVIGGLVLLMLFLILAGGR